MNKVDLTIKNNSANESFLLLDVEVPKGKSVNLPDMPFSRANALVIAASGVSSLEVSVKGMTASKHGLITNELGDLRVANAELQAKVDQLTQSEQLANATVEELNIVVTELRAEIEKLTADPKVEAQSEAPAPVEAETEPKAKPKAEPKAKKGAKK